MENLPENVTAQRRDRVGVWDLRVADEAALANYIVTAADIDRQPVVFAAAEKTLWVPNAVGSPGTFQKMGGAGVAGSGDVVGPGSATDNAIARFDTTTGKIVQNSAVKLDDNGRAANSGSAVADLGATFSDLNRTITGGGADRTDDFAMPDDSMVRVIVESWVLINSKYEHLISEVLCRRVSGGNVVVHDTTRNTYTPDPSGGVIDATYHAFSFSTTNLRLTRKAHASQNGIWTTHVWLASLTPKPQ